MDKQRAPARIPLFHILFLLFIGFASQGCQLPELRYQSNDSESGRDNFARYLNNRAVTAFYRGDDRTVEESLEIALEVAPELDPVRVFWERRYSLQFKPGYLVYRDAPGEPENREVPGSTLRAIAYPIWGLPWDIVDMPLKGILATPGLGIVLYPITILAYPYPRKPPPPGERGSSVRIGVGVGAATSVGSRGSVGIGGSPAVVFLIINALPSAVYFSRWADRVDGWGRCATWWFPWAADKLHITNFDPEQGLGSAFFANARRITVEDQALIRVKRDLVDFYKTPIEVHNSRMEENNNRILSLPRKTNRLEVGLRLEK
ncbi:MAG: hypothetical protein P1V97_19695 [Planctomycetota bacterium]|nr:hypothetical protein [Planctomycetota bacterium]